MKKVIFLFFLVLTLCFFSIGCKKNNDDDKGGNNNFEGGDDVEVDWGDLSYDQQNGSLYDLI